jgi:hypothetical protein
MDLIYLIISLLLESLSFIHSFFFSFFAYAPLLRKKELNRALVCNNGAFSDSWLSCASIWEYCLFTQLVS